MAATIHPTAVIDPAANLAGDVEIGAYCVIEGAVTLGPGCVLKPHAHLIGPITLGARNTVYPSASLGGRPQHLRYDGTGTGIVIGDGNTFRECVTVHNGTLEAGTRIGDGNYFMACSHVGHDCLVANNVILANGVLLGGHVTIQDGVFMSGNSAIHQFGVIGRLAMVSGGATSSKDIPPFFIQEGRNRVVGVNVVGMRRAGMKALEIDAVREAFRILYLQRKLVPVATEQMERVLGHIPAVMELVAFIRGSKRGIIFHEGHREVA